MHRVLRVGRGLTLVEVLVALLVMAVLAAMAWQGLDVIVRSRDAGAAATGRVMRLNTVVTQWEQDLQALHETGAVPALAFDGQALRLTRRVDEGVVLVVWAVRGGRWQRWAAPPARRAGALREAWLRSQQLVGNEPGTLELMPAIDWQVYFFRGNAWSNAQSTGDVELVGGGTAPSPPPAASAPGPGASAPGGPSGAASAPDSAASAPRADAPAPVLAREVLPQGVRMVLTLEGGGVLVRDIALGAAGG